MIRMIIQAAKRWSSAEDPTLDKFGALFSRTDKPDESGRTVLQLAVDKNNVDAVRLILEEDPSNQDGGIVKRNGLMRLIYKAIDKKYSDDIVTLLSQTYQVRINPDHKDALKLILAIKNLDEDSVSTLLENSRHLDDIVADQVRIKFALDDIVSYP
ncbi:hypothetical protein POM88_053669 [Heracleum sosnowskyi]|uniref:Ankyrin repeat protein n=1 Tax=Heracleum sosnowskyi TaxID=360622 RepID=A0AAD8GQ40_9APIA|nr:hypothetical protein POM88_053669 [Heracleum sosnowskyi]